jgi:hypothetical protein
MRAVKSKGYQHRIVEIGFEQAKLNNFSEDKGIGSILQENSYSEEISPEKNIIYGVAWKNTESNSRNSRYYSVSRTQSIERQSRL